MYLEELFQKKKKTKAKIFSAVSNDFNNASLFFCFVYDESIFYFNFYLKLVIKRIDIYI